MDKLIITVAPTNTKWFKKDNPNMPQTPDEIAADAIEAFREGARSPIFTRGMKTGG